MRHRDAFAQVEAASKQHVPAFRRAIVYALQHLKRGQEPEIRRGIERREADRVIRALPWDAFRNSLTGLLEPLFVSTAASAAKKAMHRVKLTKQVDPRLAAIFNLTNPRAVLAAATEIANLVSGIEQETKDAIREIIRRGALGELDVDHQARLIRNLVGLNSQQTNAAINFEQGLVDAGDFSDAQISTRVDRYVSDALDYRAEMIARTETIRAANLGQQELWQQAAEGGLFDRADALQVWVASPDACPICLDLDGQTAPLGEPFDSSEGPVYAPPDPHPNCRCALSLDTSGVLSEA